MQVVLVFLGSADVMGKAVHGDSAGVDGVEQYSASLWSRVDLEEARSSGGSYGGVACPQVSHLMASCWWLHQNSGVPPEKGAGPSCLAGSKMGG